MKEELFLPKEYKCNKPISNEESSVAFWDDKRDNKRTFLWQVPVYLRAKVFIKEYQSKIICDLGCGTGVKTNKYLTFKESKTFGVDQKSGIKVAKSDNKNVQFVEFDIEDEPVFEWIKKVKPDFIIFSDVIEHLEFPRKFLTNLFNCMDKNSLVLISTPDRKILDKLDVNGPPKNTRHVQEWTAQEFSQLVENIGFSNIKSQHLLPRKYNFNIYEISRFIYRLLFFKQVPDKKTCMAFLLQKD